MDGCFRSTYTPLPEPSSWLTHISEATIMFLYCRRRWTHEIWVRRNCLFFISHFHSFITVNSKYRETRTPSHFPPQSCLSWPPHYLRELSLLRNVPLAACCEIKAIFIPILVRLSWAAPHSNGWQKGKRTIMVMVVWELRPHKETKETSGMWMFT